MSILLTSTAVCGFSMPVGAEYSDMAASFALGQTETIAVGVLVGLAVSLVAFALYRHKLANSAQSLARSLQEINSPADEFSMPLGVSRELSPLAHAIELAWWRLREAVARAERERDDMVAVLSRMADGVVVTDARGTVVFINRTQLARLRLPESRVLGRSFIEAVKDHEIHSMVRDCLSSRCEVKGIVEVLPGRRFFGVTATPLPEDGGCVVVLQDLTELRRLEKVRRDFVANISHELRTPLASLKLLAETLESGGSDDPTLFRDFMGRIGVEVDRLAQMVDELGELSLIETGQVALEREPVNVVALIERAAERLEAQAVRAGLGLLLEVPDNLPQPPGDARRLEQVLVNLMHNAIKFTAAGGSVTLAAKVEDERVVISVADTGTGIAQDELERIFERFYKVDKSRSSRGTGLGLAIARHIVDAHGGSLWAESVEGAGSTFFFSLPLYE